MSRRPIRVVTFDLDNTLWDVEPALHRAERAQNDWLRHNRPRVFEHFDEDGLREFRVRIHRRHAELAHQISKIRVRALLELQLHAGYSEPLSRAGARAAFEAFLAERHKVEPYERALEVLESLAREFTLGALSNGNADIFKLDIGEYFDFAFSAEQMDAGKPLPDLFQAAMRTSGAAGHEIVHVGDNPEHDVLGAQRAGMFTVWMNSGGWRWPRHRKPADEDITSLDQLPAALGRIAVRARRRELTNGCRAAGKSSRLSRGHSR